MPIAPSIGRVVWYYPQGSGPMFQPLAAIVAHVIRDDCVNLAVFDTHGRLREHPSIGILLIQDDAQPPKNGDYCCWPKREAEPKTIPQMPIPQMPKGGDGTRSK